MSALYRNYKSADLSNVDPGYGSNAWIVPISYLTTIQDPVISDPEVPGERVTIGTSHVFASGKGAIAVYMPPKEAEAPGKMSGVALANTLVFSPKVILAGDNAVLLDLVQKLQKESFLLFFEDSKKCENGTGYIQFGSRCTPATIVGGDFASGKTGDNARKQYTLEIEAFDKFFYTGAITELS